MIAFVPFPNTVASSHVATLAAATLTSGLRTQVQVTGTNASAVTLPSGDMNGSDLSTAIEVVEKWDAESNARFKELARAEALRELSVAEFATLERLTRLRRRETYPRSADEILWQRRQAKLTHDLLHALNAYVEFHESPNRS